MNKIPMLCFNCGNAVLTSRDEVEFNAAAIGTYGCNICDDNDCENLELFYIDRIGRTLSFGQWMDEEEMARA